jgi:hypothetical protein
MTDQQKNDILKNLEYDDVSKYDVILLLAEIERLTKELKILRQEQSAEATTIGVNLND